MMATTGTTTTTITKLAIQLRVLLAFVVLTIMAPFTTLMNIKMNHENNNGDGMSGSGPVHESIRAFKHQQQQQQQRHPSSSNNNFNNNNNGYVDPLSSYTSSSSSSSNNPLPIPIQIMEQYKQWHSADAIRRNPHNRTYTIGFYTCPYSAGNRIHEYLNDVLWSIITNRTILWKYFDSETCEKWKLKPMKHQLKCHELNTVQDCDNIIIRAPWIMSYDLWSTTLNETSSGGILLDNIDTPYFAPETQFLTLQDKHKAYERVLYYNSSNTNNTATTTTTTTTDNDANASTTSSTASIIKKKKKKKKQSFLSLGKYKDDDDEGEDEDDEDHDEDDEPTKPPHKIVAFPRIVGQVDFTKVKSGFFGGRGRNSETRVIQPPKGWSNDTATQLYSLGKPFLYGMLHRYVFDFSKAVKQSVPGYRDHRDLHNHQQEQEDNTYTVALHSRHPNGLDGCVIKPETRCLKKILKKKMRKLAAVEASSGGGLLNTTTTAAHHNNNNNNNNNIMHMPLIKCKVWLLADRACTISTLKNWLELVPKCEVYMATHDTGTGTRDEHGPFAGIGFFQDLALASSNARHAVIGSPDRSYRMRTSSNLVSELVEFHRKMEAWQKGQNATTVEDADHCLLQIPLEFLLQ